MIGEVNRRCLEKNTWRLAVCVLSWEMEIRMLIAPLVKELKPWCFPSRTAILPYNKGHPQWLCYQTNKRKVAALLSKGGTVAHCDGF